MKQKLIQLLKTLYASKGFNTKEVEQFADLVISQNQLQEDSSDEDLTAAAEGAKGLADFTQKVASRQVTDVKKPTEEPKPANQVEDKTEPEIDKDMPSWAKALIESNKALSQGLEKLNAEKVGNSRREQYLKTLDGVPEAFKTKALKDFDRLSFTDDDDFNTWLTESAEDAKLLAQEAANDTNVSRTTPGAGGTGKAAKEATQDELDAAFSNLRI